MDKQTSDMYLASTLVAYGAEIDTVDKEDIKRQMFIFKSLPKVVWVLENGIVLSSSVTSISEVKALMVSEKLMYPPNFVNAIKSVKSYLYSE